MQRMFLSAPDFVVRAVADMAAGRPADRDAIRRFVAGSPAAAPDGRLPERIKRPAAPARGGAYHDIRLYADELNATYLGNRSTAEIAWGRKISAGIRRSIQFGSYDPTRNRITMNRRLDRAGIPRYFVEYILFHEMLHEVLGIGERADGRRDIHGRVFKLMESTYPDFDKALRYERELCKQLHLL
ncbi:MAG: hypothetical protein LBT97_11035 [Planctomycetota bacterium]|nr:hypothetical protein [Planctomycetota bacterium]